MLSLTILFRSRRVRTLRRRVACGMRCVGAAFYWLAGGPIALGRSLMRAGSVINGRAYLLELDRDR